jgi:hypothetical protein
MNAYVRRSLTAVAVCACLFGANGCGSSDKAVSTWTPGWVSFTPGDADMSRANQIQKVAAAAINATARTNTDGLFTGLAAIDDVLVHAGTLGRQMRARASSQIDYAGLYGVHWVGAWAMNDGERGLNTLTVTGTTNTTTVTLSMTIDFTGNSDTATAGTDLSTLRVVGTVPTVAGGASVAQVHIGMTNSDQWTSPGTVAFSGTGTTTIDAWVGTTAGAGLFWTRVQGSLAETFNSDGTTYARTRSGTLTATASNGMSTAAAFATGGGVTGSVKDAGGAALATYTGNYQTGQVQVN